MKELFSLGHQLFIQNIMLLQEEELREITTSLEYANYRCLQLYNNCKSFRAMHALSKNNNFENYVKIVMA